MFKPYKIYHEFRHFATFLVIYKFITNLHNFQNLLNYENGKNYWLHSYWNKIKFPKCLNEHKLCLCYICVTFAISMFFDGLNCFLTCRLKSYKETWKTFNSFWDINNFFKSIKSYFMLIFFLMNDINSRDIIWIMLAIIHFFIKNNINVPKLSDVTLQYNVRLLTFQFKFVQMLPVWCFLLQQTPN